MNVSIDISMYPLREDFEPGVIEFIRALRASGLHVEENGLSTQVFGAYEEVMAVVNKFMFESMRKEGQCAFVLKVVSGDRRDHDPDY